MVVYIVEINYIKFEFINGATAINFAELAMASAVEDVRIEITLKAVPKQEPENIEPEEEKEDDGLPW